MKKRIITRVAFLQNYEGMPEKLLGEIDEVAAKGYAMIMTSGLSGESERELARRADERGLGVGIFTGYVKYDHRYLAEHPDQQMVHAIAHVDQDGLSTSGCGCPFNPELKARYFRLLRELATYPGIVHIDLNDEAIMGHGCYCATCRAEYESRIGGEMPCKPDPQPADWDDPRWRRYLLWRMERWHAVHREMAEVIHAVNPKVRTSFQASPASDLWQNVWFTAIDLAGMAEYLDCISTDPYYTFHPRKFDPAEVYLSEWSRFLAGIVPEGKTAVIVPQGFSHPTFTRPLNEADGIWAAIVPPACGVNQVSPYTYTLQRCSPMQEAYEHAWRKLDPHFNEALPIRHIGVVHGVRTEVLRYPLPQETPLSYDGTRMLAVTESLRQNGVPYGFVPDARLRDVDALRRFRLISCPEIACMSRDERDGFASYIRAGGNAMILGELGAADETGADCDRSLLAELFDFDAPRLDASRTAARRFSLTDEHPAESRIQRPDPQAARRFFGGTCAPFFELSHCRDVAAPGDARVIAEFCDDSGATRGAPAIMTFDRYGGRVVYLAGFPTRTSQNTTFRTWVRNLAHQLVARLAEWAAGTPCPLRVEGWPPSTPLGRVRPIDHRFMTTCEFFPLEGEDHFLGVITSYFGEPTSFPMVLTVPAGRRVTRVVELLSDDEVPFDERDGEASINVELTFDTPALVFRFQLA